MKLLYFLATYLAVFLATYLTAEPVSPAVHELTNGNLLFSARTYQELAKYNNKNFLVCPLSVSTILALLEAGAGGETARQLLSGLNLPDSSEKTQKAYKAVAPSLNVQGDYTLSSANKLFINEHVEINPDFKRVATDVFSAEVDTIDFSKVESVGEINRWVSDKTQDKIKDILSRRDVSKDTSAVLVNALYFHGDWLNPFRPERTKRKSFYTLGTTETKVDIMDQTGSFYYYEDRKLNAKFLELGYRGDDITLTIVLPDDKEGLPLLESKIAEVLKKPEYSTDRVHVQIPRIRIEDTINFIPVLQQLGIEDVFNPAANLTGIALNQEKLYVSKVVQKTFIDIDEKGTTAAAATAVIVFPGMPRPPPLPPKEFNADHPFIFYLKYPYGILFLGRYVG